jgi:hypothetical protein
MGDVCLRPIFHPDFELPSAVAVAAVEHSINLEA